MTLFTPFQDSTQVSPIQVILKTTSITVIKNDKDEIIPIIRIQSQGRVCINYRKLNSTTRKDHFSAPFEDQMLQRSVVCTFYCFLDRCSSYTQVPVAHEDQDRTIFTCPFSTYDFRKMSFSLCNVLRTFQRCMIFIFSNLIEQSFEILMDDFSIYGDSFSNCLISLENV